MILLNETGSDWLRHLMQGQLFITALYVHVRQAKSGLFTVCNASGTLTRHSVHDEKHFYGTLCNLMQGE